MVLQYFSTISKLFHSLSFSTALPKTECQKYHAIVKTQKPLPLAAMRS